jgi:hypothetical protein
LHDIPEVTTRVVEHRLHKRRCGCGVVTVAAAPAGVSAPVVYGPNLGALAVYQHCTGGASIEVCEGAGGRHLGLPRGGPNCDAPAISGTTPKSVKRVIAGMRSAAVHRCADRAR